MRSLVDRLTGRDKSASTAKERLQVVLIHDRTELPPGMMEDLRDELISVISRHVKVNNKDVHIEIARDGREQRLIADFPIQALRRRKTS